MAEVKKNSPVINFLNLMGAHWDYALPLTTQWAVAIVPDTSDFGDPSGLFDIIKDYTQIDASSFYVPTKIQNIILNEKTQPKLDGLGLYYAMGIKMAKEGFAVSPAGIEGMGGYLKGYVGNDRNDMHSRHLSIDFIHTNLDFIEGLIRPWIIAASYKGLIFTGKQNSIKASISVQEFTRERNDENLKPTRIIHLFEGCVPIDIPETTLNYEEETVKINTVTWAFEKYTYQVDPENLTEIKF